MSFFSTALNRILERPDLTQSLIAQKAGVSPSVISRYKGGGGKPGAKAMARLIDSFPKQEDRIQLVIAHLLDETPPSIRNEIILTKKTTADENCESLSKMFDDFDLPDDLENDFLYLRDLAIANPAGAKVISSSAAMFRSRYPDPLGRNHAL